MVKKLRYEKPADNRRPYGSHRYEVWSPKLRRGVTLYGYIALKTWIYLESLPDIKAFCERPLAFNKSVKSRRVADFWVQWIDKEEIWLLKRPGEQKKLDQDKRLYPQFQEWVEANGMEPRLIAPDLVQLEEVAMNNWFTILHFLAANYDQICNRDDLQNNLLDFCTHANDLQTLQLSEKREDPVIVQAAVFYLLHKGRLKAEGLDEKPRSITTEFSVA